MPINAARRRAKKESIAKKESGEKRRQAKKQGKQNGKPSYRQQIREKKLAEGAKAKDGCAPKLFMLLLPFMAIGAYLFLRQ